MRHWAGNPNTEGDKTGGVLVTMSKDINMSGQVLNEHNWWIK